MNEWSSFKSFLDIDEKLSVSSNALDERKQQKSIQNDKTKVQENKKTSKESPCYDCEVCKKEGRSNYRFPTKEKLNKHMESHKER